MYKLIFFLIFLKNYLLNKSQSYPLITNKSYVICPNFHRQPNVRIPIPILDYIVYKEQVNIVYISPHQSIEKIERNLSLVYCKITRPYNFTFCKDNSQTLWIAFEHLLDNDDIKIDRHIRGKNFSNKFIILIIEKQNRKINLTCTIFYGNDNIIDLPRYPFNKKSLFGIIFLISCVSLTFILCIGWFIVIYYRQYEQRRIKTKLKNALAHSVQRILDKTPIIIFNSNKKTNHSIDNDSVCAICLESFIDNDKIRKLICLHYFHTACIDPWLLANQSCPLCNRNILEDNVPSISAHIKCTNEEINNRESRSTHTPNFINNTPIVELSNSN
ncbi:unnamed protein product [Rotaria sp. Silwood1]|nr:unnamed protein product [Rotaria sp. Silwood1]CAF4983408.1 unnamed protein product [Rotaria sp. Silwood1]